jgi:hypothetical protein
MIGPQEIILFVIIFVIIIPLAALINILTNQFRGNDKIIWVLVVLFIPVIGSILYFLK